MILIIGLGNPGKKYQLTRHNLGFLTINNLQLTIDKFSDWKNIKKLEAKISKGEISGKKIILAKPQTFMNLSGQAVKKLTDNLQLTTNNLWVIHDDIDLPLGKMRISIGRGAAGHKGVQSIINELKTKNFVRFRIGIQPTTYNLQLTTVEKFVLKKFTKEEEKILKSIIEKTAEAIEFSIKNGVEKAMTKFN